METLPPAKETQPFTTEAQQDAAIRRSASKDQQSAGEAQTSEGNESSFLFRLFKERNENQKSIFVS
uniref:Uncharacterized protein n=1 Tax=Romanomermis culicivorax TaxID=13658 RepID=A0A915JSV5_ROMCU